MNYVDGKSRFIESWGKLAINWGMNRTIGQVHALLLISCKPKCADEIMDDLKISRGNANTTLRKLIEWGIVHKHLIPGERKEYFTAEKDMWKVLSAIVIMRKKRELDPMIKVLDEISSVQPRCEDSQEFCRTVNEIKMFSDKAESALDNLAHAESKWLMGTVLKLMR